MKTYLVKDLAVPISEYATVEEGSTLFDAILALESAQERYRRNKYQHRAILVLDRAGRVVGKLNQADVIRALEPKDERIDRLRDIGKFGFSDKFIYSLREKAEPPGRILERINEKARRLAVEEVMHTPSEGEYVDEETSLDTACHQLVSGNHLSLLVSRGHKVTGILRMSDVFSEVSRAIRNEGPDTDPKPTHEDRR